MTDATWMRFWLESTLFACSRMLFDWASNMSPCHLPIEVSDLLTETFARQAIRLPQPHSGDCRSSSEARTHVGLAKRT